MPVLPGEPESEAGRICSRTEEESAGHTCSLSGPSKKSCQEVGTVHSQSLARNMIIILLIILYTTILTQFLYFTLFNLYLLFSYMNVRL